MLSKGLENMSDCRHVCRMPILISHHVASFCAFFLQAMYDHLVILPGVSIKKFQQRGKQDGGREPSFTRERLDSNVWYPASWDFNNKWEGPLLVHWSCLATTLNRSSLYALWIYVLSCQKVVQESTVWSTVHRCGLDFCMLLKLWFWSSLGFHCKPESKGINY